MEERVQELEKEIERLRSFLRSRVATETKTRYGGNATLRKIAKEAERMLAEPDYYPGAKG